VRRAHDFFSALVAAAAAEIWEKTKVEKEKPAPNG
jgi:hypothetical protein